MLRDTRCENPTIFSDMPGERTLGRSEVIIVVVFVAECEFRNLFHAPRRLSPLNGDIYVTHRLQDCPVTIEASRLVLLSDFDGFHAKVTLSGVCLQPGPWKLGPRMAMIFKDSGISCIS